MKLNEKMDFNSFFDQVNLYCNDLTKKIKGYEIINKDKKTILVFNACGIEEKDVSIKLELEDYSYRAYLVVSASTYNEELDKTYNVFEKIAIDVDDYKEVNYEIKNGLLIVELVNNIPNTSKIKINHK